MNELDNLLATGTKVTLSTGREQLIKPFKLRQFGQVMEQANKIGFKVTDGDVNFGEIISKHYEEIINILTIALGWPVEEVDDLTLDDAVVIAAAILKVNVDFFTQRVAPKLEDATRSVMLKSDGQQ